ncbi:hypothetical protein H6F75_00635 [Nodosilinea sp. FACHB-131]|uniref:hypothetical protein n=1 Tax=Cyanophyceae TaxID=3028117 RepID=UPI001683BF23|nr:hypothetical protein [Nodosilinea sp. FACHB-131]MBD1871977.1 hypothetical protein [Nodosilinea sp. FACHB-131]
MTQKSQADQFADHILAQMQAQGYVMGQIPQAQVMPPQGQQQQQKPQAQQQGQGKQKQTQGKQPMKSASPRPFGANLFAPAEWAAKSIAWLTNPTARGGLKFVAYTMSVGCMILSTETVYTALPLSQSAQTHGIENPRALPKPGIPDGADIAQLNPIPMALTTMGATANFATGWLPFGTNFKPNKQWTVWGDPNWYAALAIALAIGGVEAMAIRRMQGTWEKRYAKFQKLNSRKVPDLSPSAVIAARAARAELQLEGTDGYVGVFLLIIMVYGVEFYAFFRSISGLQLPFFTMAVYALINVFGFELAWSIAQQADEKE